jgi:pimeloyl-ACP methyl ester carboxylesterase
MPSEKYGALVVQSHRSPLGVVELTQATTDVTRVAEDVEVAGLRIRVTSRGSGPPVFVLHHSTGPFWTPFYDVLAQTCTVSAPDMPGFGRSERPTAARSPRDVAILCLQLLDVLAAGPVHLVGLGLGGWVAAEMATMHQQGVETLTLVGAAGIKPRVGQIHDPMMAGWIDYARLSFRNQESFDEIIGSDPPPELIELWDHSREMTARITWRPWMWSGTLPSFLLGVRTPTLVVWGDSDRVVPLDCAEQYARILPDAQLELVEAAGHAVDLERPDELAALVDAFVVSRGR